MVGYNSPISEEKNAITANIAKQTSKAFLFEIAWEVCQQVGGIYTVIRSKVPAMIDIWQKQYCLIGPYDPAVTPQEFEEKPPSRLLAPVLAAMEKAGYEVHYGHWLITGRPQVVMLNPQSVMKNIGDLKYFLWEHSHISFDTTEELMDKTIAFGFLCEQFFIKLAAELAERYTLVAHFHEWLAGGAIEKNKTIPLAYPHDFHDPCHDAGAVSLDCRCLRLHTLIVH